MRHYLACDLTFGICELSGEDWLSYMNELKDTCRCSFYTDIDLFINPDKDEVTFAIVNDDELNKLKCSYTVN